VIALPEQEKSRLWLVACWESLKRLRFRDAVTAFRNAGRVPVPEHWPNGQRLYSVED
jgi:hypothetical protein